VITVALITVQRGGHAATRWLCAFFLMYAIALAVFLAAPVLGPPIYAPASFDSQLKTTLTFRLMDGMATEYRQLLTGGGLSGFGYFVAVPSLHVAAAILMQGMMRPYPYVYWTWLPANVLLVLSTVVLGYHYILDVPAGYCITLLIRRYASFEPLEGQSARMIEAIGPGADTRSYRPAGAV
jgi:membrane-associated phospholipid phosphatase